MITERSTSLLLGWCGYTLSYLRKGETFAGLAAGFGVGAATAWRYVTKTAPAIGAGQGEAASDLSQAGSAPIGGRS